VCVCVCVDYVLVLCFVGLMGYVLQYGEIVHKKYSIFSIIIIIAVAVVVTRATVIIITTTAVA